MLDPAECNEATSSKTCSSWHEVKNEGAKLLGCHSMHDVVAKAKREKVVNEKQSGANGLANVRSFQKSVERTVRDMGEGSDEFGRAAERRVLNKQLS